MLVLLRHGQSVWNLEDRFTGWTDVDLTQVGIGEARRAGTALRQHGERFDLCVTSVLTRAIRTAWIVLDQMELMWLPVAVDWRLNERHYGALQGLNKAETARQAGAEQVRRWRRSFDARPPALSPDDPRHPARDPRYAGIDPQHLPATESLRDTAARVMPVWSETIAPRIAAGANVLVVAHGNSLRALVKHLDGISDADIAAVEIATGVPITYDFDTSLRPTRRHAEAGIIPTG